MFDIADIQSVEHDVIIIGAGGAGLRAAIECSKRGLSTGVVCKSLLGIISLFIIPFFLY